MTATKTTECRRIVVTPKLRRIYFVEARVWSMRAVDAKSLVVAEIGETRVHYAILSYRWEEGQEIALGVFSQQIRAWLGSGSVNTENHGLLQSKKRREGL